MLTKFLTLILCIFGSRREVGEQRQCQLNSRIQFGEWLPIYIRNGKLLEPDDKYGNVILEHGEVLAISCDEGVNIYHPNVKTQTSTSLIKCHGDDLFVSDQLLNGPSPFSQFKCNSPPTYISQQTNRTCYDNHGIFEIGYKIRNEFYPVYETCFDKTVFTPIYSKYNQKPYNANFQQKVERPFFKADSVYKDTPVEQMFSPRQLQTAVAEAVGSRIGEYYDSRFYLSRGHLAAKTDFVFAFGERATFHYINCAAQWYGFNSGNWNSLEVDLRNRINNKGYNTIIYTGVYEILHLKNDQERNIPIYLYSDFNNNPVVPVPLYYYKVVYEPNLMKGIAFVGINNPHCVDENRTVHPGLIFCNDVCRGKNEFSWLTWMPDDFYRGIAFCCTVEDFRRTVDHLPYFEVRGLLI